MHNNILILTHENPRSGITAVRSFSDHKDINVYTTYSNKMPKVLMFALLWRHKIKKPFPY